MTFKCDIAVVIPARYQSSRFPGKPLAMIAGTSLIKRVWAQCARAIDAAHVYVATDDIRIANHCESFGANVIMTSDQCLTGTDRLAEVASKVEAKIYVNVQGDEPLIDPKDIHAVIEAFTSDPRNVVCGMCPIVSPDDYESRTVPKVVTRPDGRLLYMSRSPIPGTKTAAFVGAMKQVCIYAFTKTHLESFASQQAKTPLEKIEDIEILRFLETNWDIRMVEVSGSSIAVDVPADITRVEEALRLMAGAR